MPNQFLPNVTQIPSKLIIEDISRSFPMVITYSTPENSAFTYIPGMLVKLTVPITYGMFQANGLIGKILSIGSSTISLNIDSSLFDAFTIPVGNTLQPASLSPAGSQNLEYSNLTDQVGFQSYNNIGN